MQAKYAGRPENSVPLQLSLQREAVEYLWEVSSQKGRGDFISLLLLQDRARREERERLRAERMQESLAAGPSLAQP